jgi:hypothetical protein
MKKILLSFLIIVFSVCLYDPAWADSEKPAPDGSGTFAELDGDNEFTEGQSAIYWTTPLPSVKGAPDTQALRNSTDVPIVSYAPEGITCGIYRPIVPDIAGKTAAYTILATESYNNIFTNEGTAGMVFFSLPAALVGMKISFMTDCADGIRVIPTPTDRILLDTDAKGDYIESNTRYGHLTLESLFAGSWSVISSKGTWTKE